MIFRGGEMVDAPTCENAAASGVGGLCRDCKRDIPCRFESGPRSLFACEETANLDAALARVQGGRES